MYRQGDVLLVPIDVLPADIEPVPREAERIVLAHGEATGHAHAIAGLQASLWEARNGARFLRVESTCDLLHEEHDPIELRPGAYRVIRQVEYVPGPRVARTHED
jgi:hypothetical protein